MGRLFQKSRGLRLRALAGVALLLAVGIRANAGMSMEAIPTLCEKAETLYWGRASIVGYGYSDNKDTARLLAFMDALVKVAEEQGGIKATYRATLEDSLLLKEKFLFRSSAVVGGYEVVSVIAYENGMISKKNVSVKKDGFDFAGTANGYRMMSAANIDTANLVLDEATINPKYEYVKVAENTFQATCSLDYDLDYLNQKLISTHDSEFKKGVFKSADATSGISYCPEETRSFVGVRSSGSSGTRQDEAARYANARDVAYYGALARLAGFYDSFAKRPVKVTSSHGEQSDSLKTEGKVLLYPGKVLPGAVREVEDRLTKAKVPVADVEMINMFTIVPSRRESR